MARDERLKKVSGAGADLLETARAKAEEFLRELSRATGSTQERAQGAFDDLVQGGRKGTDQLIATIRAEISTQVKALGLATHRDLSDLEKRIGAPVKGKTPAAKKTAAAKKAPAKKTAAAKKAPAKKTAAAKKAPAKKTAAAKKAPAKKTAS